MISRHLASARSAATAALAGLLLSACGGGGGGGGGGQPPPTNVTISGTITFDRIPFDTVLGNGLNPTAVTQAPARQVTVQAIAAAGDTVLATTTTDTVGNYSLSVAANTNMFIRARAEMVKTGAAPTWNFSVRNNTTAGANDALYAIDGSAASSGTANSTRNLNAPSGFSGNNYVAERAAAPFAILDTVYRAKELVLTAAPTTAFPELRLFWSDDNRPTVGRFCPDTGDIATSSYIVFAQGETDSCGQTNGDGIYILGDFTQGDTDEFDQSVIAHEFGHYFEDRFSRSDSIGGDHGGAGDLLDLRVAFGEGWGNAFSSMVRGDAVYRDSQNGMASEFFFNVETDDQNDEGWFSEASVQEILWDLFDPANEPGDTVALGFTPLFTAMTGAQLNTDALTSIYTFSAILRATTPAVDDLLDAEQISGTDDFGAAEGNDAGDPAILPVYRTIILNTPINVCSRSPGGNVDTNKLGNRVFLRFDNSAARLVAIQATGAAAGSGTDAATDPDIFVLRQGALVNFGTSTTPGQETIPQFQLPQGTFIIEVYDFELTGTSARCMTVSITG